MKLLRSAFCLLKCNRNKPFLVANRFFCDTGVTDKKSEIKTEQNAKQTQQENSSEQTTSDRYSVENTLNNGIIITSYNEVGFRLNHTIKVIGPIITFPKTVLSWHIESFERINADSLMIFGLIQPRIETLIIGAGADETSSSKLGQSVLEIMHKFKINVEILTTELACTQFNYLNAEGRMIAAALIPPKIANLRDEDAFQSLDFDSKLYSIDNTHERMWKKFIK